MLIKLYIKYLLLCNLSSHHNLSYNKLGVLSINNYFILLNITLYYFYYFLLC